VAKEFNQNWLWPFVEFQFMTNFNVTGYDGDVECARVQVFRNSMNF